MPELPEVETVVRDIARPVQGQVLSRLELAQGAKRSLEGNLASFNAAVANHKVKAVTRRAKYIVIHLDNHSAISVHLRMTGRLYLPQAKRKISPYVRAVFHFKSGRKLLFEDTRRFGKIKFWPDPEVLNNQLGFEPLESAFTVQALTELLQASRRQIKPFLLDQTKIAGLGNIYVDEALWRSAVHPLRITESLSKSEIKLLWKAIRLVLEAGIRNNGTTFDSFYFGEGKKGNYASLLKVFDRTGQPCSRCKTKIIKIKVAQRGTHICPQCQK